MGLNNRKENRKMEQTIQLSDHFGYRRLIRFTIPSFLSITKHVGNVFTLYMAALCE